MKAIKIFLIIIIVVIAGLGIAFYQFGYQSKDGNPYEDKDTNLYEDKGTNLYEGEGEAYYYLTLNLMGNSYLSGGNVEISINNNPVYFFGDQEVEITSTYKITQAIVDDLLRPEENQLLITINEPSEPYPGNALDFSLDIKKYEEGDTVSTLPEENLEILIFELVEDINPGSNLIIEKSFNL